MHPREPLETTFSFWRDFVSGCPRRVEYRYLEGLVPQEEPQAALRFGTVVHDWLQGYYGGTNLAALDAGVDAAYPQSLRQTDPKARQMWNQTKALLSVYADRYSAAEFDEVVALEWEFRRQPIEHPQTGEVSTDFVLSGKVDGIVRLDGLYYVLEHKTATSVDKGYLEKLWTDVQIHLYAHYVERVLGLKVSGVIYNVLGKSLHRMRAGETEAEFEERKAGMQRPGRAKRKMPETDEEFRARLRAWYAANPDALLRETILLDRDRVAQTLENLWKWTKHFRLARELGSFTEDTTRCFDRFGRCPYYLLCASKNDPTVREMHYRRERPHAELSHLPPSGVHRNDAFWEEDLVEEIVF